MFNFAYNTHSISVDKLYDKKNIGGGLLILMDDSGNGIYKRFKMEGIVSYRLKATDRSFFKLGIGFAYGQNSLDWNKLIFGDMIDVIVVILCLTDQHFPQMKSCLKILQSDILTFLQDYSIIRGKFLQECQLSMLTRL